MQKAGSERSRPAATALLDPPVFPNVMRTPAIVLQVLLFMCLGTPLSVADPTSSPSTADPASSPDDAVARQYLPVAMARTRAELVLRDVQTFVDENRTTYATMLDATDAARAKSLALIERAQTNEQRKPEADRSEDITEELTRRAHEIADRWQKLYAIERPALAARYEAATSSLSHLTLALTAVYAMEQQWKDLELDLSPVQHAYLEIARRAQVCARAGCSSSRSDEAKSRPVAIDASRHTDRHRSQGSAAHAGCSLGSLISKPGTRGLPIPFPVKL